MCTRLLFAAALLTAVPAPLSLLPHPSPYRMADVADAIVEGVLRDDGTVAVTDRHFAAPGIEVPAALRVEALAEMTRTPFSFGGDEQKPIRPDGVLLFLAATGAEARTWTPLHLHYGRARGVLWFQGEAVFGYAQCINPGPYELVAMEHVDGDRTAAYTPATVRAEILRGLASRAKWRAALAIEDPAARARELVSWLGPDGPDGDRWIERAWPDGLRDLARCGDAAVEPLAEVVRSHRDETVVGAAAHVLTELASKGEGARAATPALVDRLTKPAGVRPRQLIRALHALADPRAAAALRAVCERGELVDAADAAVALRRCGGADAPNLLVARLPTAVADESQHTGVVAVLEALHELEPEVAVRLVRERYLGATAMLQQRGWMRELLR